MKYFKQMANRALANAWATRSVKGRQGGFTIIELMIVLAIIALIAIFAIPFARGIVIEGAVEPTANDINKVATKIRTNFAGNGATPYTNLGSGAAATATFANTARNLAGSLTVSGTGATSTLTHALGATGSQVTVASSTITTTGDSFTVTLPTVNKAACPSLASILNRSVEAITINGTTVKAVGGTYNAGSASNACTDADTNTYVFTFR